jgi:hypothetical protein
MSDNKFIWENMCIKNGDYIHGRTLSAEVKKELLDYWQKTGVYFSNEDGWVWKPENWDTKV